MCLSQYMQMLSRLWALKKSVHDVPVCAHNYTSLESSVTKTISLIK